MAIYHLKIYQWQRTVDTPINEINNMRWPLQKIDQYKQVR
jgi:hypothetical protein